jgi:predicted transcriptional regulator
MESVLQGGTVKTLRMNEALQEKLSLAAKRSGKSESEIMREGIAARCEELIGLDEQQRDEWLQGWLRAIDEANAEPLTSEQQRYNDELLKRFPDGPSRHTKEIFAEIMDEKEARIMGRTRSKTTRSSSGRNGKLNGSLR